MPHRCSSGKDRFSVTSTFLIHFFRKFFHFALDKSKIRAIITKSLRHNRISGGVPEWPKGTDCKSAAFRFDGSNPSSPTTKRPILSGLVFLCVRAVGSGFEDPKCNNPVDCCSRRLDGAKPLFLPSGQKCKRIRPPPPAKDQMLRIWSFAVIFALRRVLLAMPMILACASDIACGQLAANIISLLHQQKYHYALRHNITPAQAGISLQTSYPL